MICAVFFGDDILNFLSSKNLIRKRRISELLGTTFLLKFCFGISIFYLVLSLLLLMKDKFAKTVNEGFFLLKSLVILGLVVVAQFIPEKFYYGLSWISYILAYLFAIFIPLALFDFAYFWNRAWLNRYEDGNKTYGYLLILFTGLNCVLFIVCVYNYITSYWIDGCALNKGMVGLLILFLLILCLAKFFNWIPDLSILSMSFLMLVSLVFAFRIIWSQDNESCRSSIDRKEVFIGFLLSHFSIFSFSFSFLEWRDESEDEEKAHKKSLVSEYERYEIKGYFLFYILLFLLSLEVPIEFFGWKNSDNGQFWSEEWGVPRSVTVVKMISFISLFILIIWSIIAPKILTSRNFD